MADILEYPYRAKPWMMLAAIAFFGACAAGMGYRAVTNDRGLILNRIFTFSVDGATIFYWCIAAAAALFVVGAILALIAGLTNPMAVRLTATDFSAPKHGFAKKLIVIALRDIKEIGIQTVHKQRFMNVYFRNGKLSIAQSMLPNSEAFERLHSGLAANVKAQKAG
jgi:hypothetical protein